MRMSYAGLLTDQDQGERFERAVFNTTQLFSLRFGQVYKSRVSPYRRLPAQVRHWIFFFFLFSTFRPVKVPVRDRTRAGGGSPSSVAAVPLV